MERIVQLTEDLVRFRSTHDRPAEIRRCAAFVEERLRADGVAYRRFDHSDIPSILVTPAHARFPVLLMSHLDVVDGPDDLFTPVRREDRLYGRGSIDDKYAVALSLVLLSDRLDALKKAGKSQADLPLGLLITGDEEIGGANGAKPVLETIDPDFCIALDGGGIDTIVTREKGILRLKLTALGRTAHGARPWLGDNAVDRLFADYERIKPFFDLSDPDHWHRTLTLSRMTAGQADNQVPGRAEALFDIRYTENDDPDELVRALSAAVDGDLKEISRAPVFDGGRSPYLDLLVSLFPEAAVAFEHGASDARHVSAKGIPAVVWGADGDLSQHAVDEHVNIPSIGTLYRRIDRLLDRVATGIQP